VKSYIANNAGPRIFEPGGEGPGVDRATVLLAVVLTVAVISLACVSFMPSISDFAFSNTLWNGLSSFSEEYSSVNLESTAGLPGETAKTLVLIPQVPLSPAELSELKDFAAGGGTLAIVDDYGHGNQVLEYLGLAARFSQLTLMDPFFCYKNPALPRITDFSPEVAEYGVTSIVLNNATTLTGVSPGDVLAWSSAESFLTAGQNPASTPTASGPFPVAARIKFGSGEVVLLSDPSIFINSMLKLEDNRLFLEYLLGKAGEVGKIQISETHLDRGAMDYAKRGLARVQEAFRQPVVAAVFLAVIFAIVFYFSFRTKNGNA